MSLIKGLILSGVALSAVTCIAAAGENSMPALEMLDAGQLAADAAPVFPHAGEPVAVSKGLLPEVPGLPLSSRDKAAFGDKATTVGVIPSAGAPKGPSVSWSGYARAGIVYHGAD